MTMNWNDILDLSSKGNLTPPRRVEKTDEEWKKILTPDQFRITRLKGTEKPFSGELCSAFGPGLYSCVCCGNLLFDSGVKFESHSGWPSFTQPIAENAISYHKDTAYGMVRIETLCSVCDAHLGHVFPDGPAPSGLRYCMNSEALVKQEKDAATSSEESIVLGGGCFWCTEAVFQEVDGVKKVVSGYSNGQKPSPTYEQVCTGNTGHAEVVKVTYDPKVVSLEDIIEIHLTTHNPTTLNRQGADVGTQYRSAIYYNNEEEKAVIDRVTASVQASFDQPIVTEIQPLESFYPAEGYHQNYFRNNPGNGYCAAVINPKLAKFRAKYNSKLKV
jgi:peptide methionine sulfoxide reductase msrA/msrB